MATKKSQKAVIQKLEEYGDSFLEEENRSKKSKKQKKKQSKNSEAEPELTDHDQNQHLNTIPKKRKKKKLTQKLRKLIKNQENGDIVKSSKKTPMNKKMKWLKEALGSDGVFDIQHTKAVSSADDKIKGEVTKRKKREPEVIVFDDPTRKKKKSVSEETSRSGVSSEFDMKTARFEVRKLGISGFAGEKKTDARVSLLINLGAKPPRKKNYMNYKEFQRKRKSDLDAEKQRRPDEQVPGEKVSRKKSKKGSKSKPDTGVDGQVGRYKLGVQFISKDTLKKLQAS